MIDEMTAYELSRLPKYEAYAKVFQEKEGEQSVFTGKVRTLPPLAVNSELSLRYPGLNLEQEAISAGQRLYCRKRVEIEREIRERQKRWQRPALPPPSKAYGKRMLPPGRGGFKPPPTSE